MAAETPQFLAVGHVCMDVVRDRVRGVEAVRPGGTATYAALTARNLGLRTAVVTSAAEYPFHDVLPGIRVHSVPAEQTTVFRNYYDSGGRRQVLARRAGDIAMSDVPSAWRSAGVVLLGPLARELPLDAAGWFDAGLIGATAQGWLRTWDEEGRVSAGATPPDAMPGNLDLLVFSEADARPGTVAGWEHRASVLAHTRGPRGVRLRVGVDGSWHDIPAVPANEVDPTGAGDVWAAAYLVRYSEVADAFEAARFACAAGGLCVEAPGPAGVPGRAAIEARLAHNVC